jgi:hypothetical protein
MKAKSYWTIIFFSWLVIFLLLAIDIWLFGPDILMLITHPKKPSQTIDEIDPNSEAYAVAAILPHVNLMCTKVRELSVQNYWLMQSLDKCLKKLETERGLEPIPLKPLFGWEQCDPNRVLKISKPNEPFFVPCKNPVDYSVFMEVNGDGTDIERLKSLMYLHLWGMSNDDWMENFKERLKRLDVNQPAQKPLE